MENKSNKKMAGYSPYKENYFFGNRKKKILWIGGFFILLILLGIYFISLPKTRDSRREKENYVSPETGSEKKEGPEKNQYPPEPSLSDKPDMSPGSEYAKDDQADREQTGITDSGPTFGKTASPEKQPEEDWQNELDLKRDQGMALLEEAIQQCSEIREQTEALQREYDNSCYGIYYDAYGNPINRSMTEQCIRLMKEIRNRKGELSKRLEMASENARKAGVYPGQIRDILAQYEFEEK